MALIENGEGGEAFEFVHIVTHQLINFKLSGLNFNRTFTSQGFILAPFFEINVKFKKENNNADWSLF